MEEWGYESEGANIHPWRRVCNADCLRAATVDEVFEGGGEKIPWTGCDCRGGGIL